MTDERLEAIDCPMCGGLTSVEYLVASTNRANISNVRIQCSDDPNHYSYAARARLLAP